MKKAIYILLITIVVLSCKNEVHVIDYAIISGKIEEGRSKQIIVSNSLSRKVLDTISVNVDGTFNDTIKLKKGYYNLKYGRGKVPMYLETGYNLNITANAKFLDSTLTITGNGSAENHFLKERKNKVKAFNGSENFYMLDEINFTQKLNEEKEIQNKLLVNNKTISANFKSAQQRDIEYNYLSALANYENYHRYYAKEPDFNVSKEFLDPLKNVNYNHEEDYSSFKAYKVLVAKYYREKAKQLSDAENIPEDVARVQTYAAVASNTMKTDLLNSAIFGITITKDLNDYYNAFKTGATDQDQLKKVEDYYSKLKLIQVGEPSPKFEGYENFAGGTTSLDDLKGKYIYIDVWATWCGPCLAQIPALKEMEKAYHGKNIQFLSISVDKPKDYEKWKLMIKDKELGGVQLLADINFDSEFIKDYVIKGIPKFILLDPEGKIVNTNAPRPSEEELKTLFDSLNI
ncbi:TlpA family protein disulfide reductase [Polaribacter butkevichii]|uniref:Thioredoxin domain-containing protein n=1 Tax=Polaribacter butkevichii TaxID=218490 RepID=A0A2P6CB98_9FLAO|nr:TlpA disulfide reductase family protein [Polaribacter butkevichii]PQJ72186.1 hypothetical protein BTO14_02495 [Polaribacter butkevichii]